MEHRLSAAGLLLRAPFLLFLSLSRNRIPEVRAAFLFLPLALAMAGCATSGDCSGDWYAIGQRDGRLGANPQAELYAQRCAAVDAGRYRDGWRDGFAQRPIPSW